MAMLGGALLWGGWLCGLLAFLAWRKAELHRVAVRTALLPGKEKPEGKSARRLPNWLLQAAESLSERGAALALSGDRERWERLLVLAGYPYALTAPLFAGLRLVLVTAGLIGGNLLVFLGLPPLTPVLLSVAAYFGPALWLRGRARSRQAQIARVLPDFLDTVACTLEAGGVGLDQALGRVAAYFDGPLAEELRRVQQELALGVPRREALQGLLRRTDCRELELLVQALVQAETIGSPVAEAFNIQAEAIRTHRAQNAREQAAKVESKLTGISTLLLAPISLAFILALLVLNLVYNPAFSGWRSVW